METNGAIVTDELKDYIAKGIQDYRWSDEFLVKNLIQKGFEEDAARQLIADVKKERRVSNKESIFNDDVPETGVSGGLAVCCVLMGLGGLLTFVLALVRYSDAEYNRSIINLMDLIQAGAYALLALFAIWKTVKRRPDAIFLMKGIILICFISNLLTLLAFTSLSGIDGTFFNPMAVIIRLFVMAFLFIYLCLARQVKILFPKEKRKVKFWDWIVVLSPILVYVVFFCIFLGKGVAQELNTANKDAIRTEIATLDNQCPVAIDSETWLKSAKTNGDTVVLTYNLVYSSSDLDMTAVKPILKEFTQSIADGMSAEINKADMVLKVSVEDIGGTEMYSSVY